jgi:YHS domain-containing protein
MLRAAVELIVGLLIAYFIRSVMSIIFKAASTATQSQQASNSGPGGTNAGGPRRPANIPQANELKKDPVCGTFVSTAVALQKSAGGQTYYFCSADCRDKFQG